jgi:hypothetical protein
MHRTAQFVHADGSISVVMRVLELLVVEVLSLCCVLPPEIVIRALCAASTAVHAAGDCSS